MTISDATATALTSYLTGSVVNASTVDNGINVGENDKFDNRVVVFSNDAQLRHEYVKGMYDVSGQVVIQQSADSEDARTMFNTLSEEVRGLLEDKTLMPDFLNGVLPELRVFTWNMKQQSANPSNRGFQAIFEWQVFAELPN